MMKKPNRELSARFIITLKPEEHATAMEYFTNERRIGAAEFRRILIAYTESEKVRKGVDELVNGYMEKRK